MPTAATSIVRGRAAPDRQQRAAQLRRRPGAFRPPARAHRRDARPARVLQPRRGGVTPTPAPYSAGPGAHARAARITVPGLVAMAREGAKIAMLTAYDASVRRALRSRGRRRRARRRLARHGDPGPRLDAAGDARRRRLPHALRRRRRARARSSSRTCPSAATRPARRPRTRPASRRCRPAHRW